MSLALKDHTNDLTQLTLSGAAAAINEGAISAQAYAAALLTRAHERRDLNAFITIEPVRVLEAASKADKHRASGGTLGALHGVPIAVKDSMSTYDLPTSAGTRVLANFKPEQDAAIVAAVRAAGAIVFGKNNLVELSYGLTGVNEHHGQARNPHDPNRVTGGSSSGAGASVAARMVPAALGGDTVGSIRIPASFCGIVGFRPTTGRWPGEGIAPISHSLDTGGPMARSVEDCALLDAIVTGSAFPLKRPDSNSLAGVRLGVAPKQFLDLVDADVERLFRETLEKLAAAGAVIVELDLGDDFATLVEGANWPVFFHETMPDLSKFLDDVAAPANFRAVFEGLGSNLQDFWREFVLPDGKNYIPAAAYRQSTDVLRPMLCKRYSDVFASTGVEALLHPTVPLTAPPLNTRDEVVVGGQTVSYLTIAKNTIPSSCAALPGISIPIGFSSEGMPIGLEMDGRHGDDVRLLEYAVRVSRAIGGLQKP